jgi:hypothetical protein
MRFRLRTLSVVLFVVLVVYVGSFLAFRATPYHFDLAPPSDPQHNLVLFSRDTGVHCAARAVYWPLIATIPGHRHYPNREQHEMLMRATHMPPGSGLQ